jgi:hypothetical protein
MFNLSKKIKTTVAVSFVYAGTLMTSVGCVPELKGIMDLIDSVEIEDVMELFDDSFGEDPSEFDLFEDDTMFDEWDPGF